MLDKILDNTVYDFFRFMMWLIANTLSLIDWVVRVTFFVLMSLTIIFAVMLTANYSSIGNVPATALGICAYLWLLYEVRMHVGRFFKFNYYDECYQ